MLNLKSLKKKLQKKKPKKRSFFGKIFRILLYLIILFFSTSLFFTFIYKFINPPVTTFMISRTISQSFRGEQIIIRKDWTNIEDISPNMVKAVIAAEDNLFVKHNGFDKDAIERAIEYNKKGKKIRGASTISQQTAKNVFLWPQRSFIRKGLEVYFTFLIETFWSKQRIMEVYLNVIEIGKGIYGVEKASSIYFNKKCKNLTKSEAALIAASLPSPIKYSVQKPGPYMKSRQSQIIDLMEKIETLQINN